VRNRLVLYKPPFAWRVTTHQAVLRLVLWMERRGQWGVELRKIGFWMRRELEAKLKVW
jgi:hypothetical protein